MQAADQGRCHSGESRGAVLGGDPLRRFRAGGKQRHSHREHEPECPGAGGQLPQGVDRGHIQLSALFQELRYKSLVTEGFDYFSAWGAAVSGQSQRQGSVGRFRGVLELEYGRSPGGAQERGHPVDPDIPKGSVSHQGKKNMM